MADNDPVMAQDARDMRATAGQIEANIVTLGGTPNTEPFPSHEHMPSGSLPPEPSTVADALANLGQDINRALVGASGSGSGNIVTDLIAKGFELLTGTTVCSKEAPQGKPAICPK